MNRNAESWFATLPNISINRSSLPLSHNVSKTFNVGELRVADCIEVLPGDTFNCASSKMLRLSTMLTPVMGSMYLDTYWFFVPNRLVWEHWKEFCGENTESAWIPQTEYSIPQLTAPSGGWDVGTIADDLRIPTGVANISVNALPFRAYALVCNEWFRDQNLTSPLAISTGDSTVTGSNGSSYITDVAKGGKPFVVAKYHDYFTSALPGPQKHADVEIPVGQDYQLPVYAQNELIPGAEKRTGLWPALYQGKKASSSRDQFVFYNANDGTQTISWQVNDPNSDLPNPPGITKISSSTSNYITPVNLWALGSGSVGAATVNQLRMAFQLQKAYETDARSGSRYTEVLRSHFGVQSPDGRLQRPEYLGGSRVPFNVSQVTQNSETANTPQGTLTGISLTLDRHDDFTKSFTEHGYLICLVAARYNHSYSQGIPRMFSRKSRWDFYWPVLARIGETPILNKEIYAQGSNVVNAQTGKAYDEEVFGYQEAWADYRYLPDAVTGQLRSTYAQSLDIWHYGDDYSQLPSLSDAWIREDKSNVDRTLAVTSAVSDQIIMDMYVKCDAVRPMPVRSIPGLVDHF